MAKENRIFQPLHNALLSHGTLNDTDKHACRHNKLCDDDPPARANSPPKETGQVTGLPNRRGETAKGI